MKPKLQSSNLPREFSVVGKLVHKMLPLAEVKLLAPKADLQSYIKPLFVICRIFCFWSFNIEIINSCENLILNLTCLAFCSMFFYCFFRQVRVMFIAVKLINSTLFAHHANEMRHIFGYATIVLTCLNNLVRRREIKESFRELTRFEHRNAALCSLRGNISTKFIYVILTMTAIIVYDSYCFTNYLTHFKFWTYIFCTVPYCLHLLYIVVYATILGIIRDMFKNMNRFVMECDKMCFRKVLHLCRLHLELFRIACQQNEFYEFPQMLYTAYAFIGFVINYNYLRITMYPIIVEHEDAMPLAMNDFIWCVYFCGTIYLIVRSWDDLECEVSNS